MNMWLLEGAEGIRRVLTMVREGYRITPDNLLEGIAFQVGRDRRAVPPVFARHLQRTWRNILGVLSASQAQCLEQITKLVTRRPQRIRFRAREEVVACA